MVYFGLLRAHAWTDHHEKNMQVDMYTDSLSFKFYGDPFTGCGEIAETNSSNHIYHF